MVGACYYSTHASANHIAGLVNVNGNNVSPLPDFTALSSQMAKVSPSSTDSNSYNPTFSPTTCPSIVTSANPTATDSNSELWLAPATPLPPPPNPQLCACQMSTLQCVSSSTDETTYEADFNYICGAVQGACSGINRNVSDGSYGAYGMCSPQQQLSYAMNKYYQAQSGAAKSSACSFSGRAKLQSTSSPTGSCVSLLQAAGTNGQGTVPEASGNSAQQSSAAAAAGGGNGVSGGSGGSGSSGSSGSTASSSKGAAYGIKAPTVDTGLLQMGAYVACAITTGAGMILL